jgi:hypothetical protein
MATTSAILSGLYKEVYADTIYSLIPDIAKVAKSVPFEKKKKLGDKYHQPVVLTAEQGFTYSNQPTAFALNPNVPMSTQDAQIKGSQIAVRYRISQEAASRSVGGGRGDKAAFREATQLQYENVMESFGKRMEIELFYGDTILATASARANTSATVTTLTIPEADWGVGIWTGMENALFNMYNGSSLISSGADAIFQLTAVDLENRTLAFTGTTTGTTALQAVAATDIDVWFLGSYGQQMAGLKRIFTNAGTLFNINAATYNLWKTPNKTFGGVGALTFQRIIESLVLPVGRGLTGDVTAYVSPLVWSQLATDLAALRVVDQTYSSAKINVGTQEIVYYYQGGAVKIVSHLVVKSGDVFVMRSKDFKRIGSTDITSTVPGGIKGATTDMFYMLPDNMGYESRMYTDQALFCEKPAHQLYITGFTL